MTATQTPSPSLSSELCEEIRMVRAVMQLVMSMTDEPHTLAELLKLLDSLSMASTRLATLLKADRQLSKTEDLSEALNEALAELLNEMRIAE